MQKAKRLFNDYRPRIKYVGGQWQFSKPFSVGDAHAMQIGPFAVYIPF